MSATTNAAKVVEIAAPKLRALPRPALKLRESVNNEWRCVIPRGTPREYLTLSDFWVIAGSDLQPWDRIAAVAEDRSFFCELLVLDAGRGYANVTELAFHTLPPLVTSQAGLPPGHSIFHSGPEKLYCIKREKDGVLLGEGFPSRDDALRALLDHASLR